MSRITDIAKTMKTWWNEDDDPFVHRALDEIIRIDQEQLSTIEPKTKVVAQITFGEEKLREIVKEAVERFKEEYEITDRPQGEWVTVWDECGENENGYECSECGAEVDEKFPNCPYCGVRMKGVDDE